MRVLATDQDLEALQRVASAAAWPDDRIFLARLDVTSAASWDLAIQHAEAKLGKIDLLFNVAGVMRAEWIQDTPLDDINTVVDVDLKGVMLGTRFAARHMIPAGGGHIINVSSMLGLTPGPGLSVYTGAKYGVRGFSLSAALELEAHRVAVTLVCPDKVETGLFDFPNVHGPQAALAWSGPDPLDPDKLAHAILRDVVSRKPLVYCIPRHRGIMARLSEILPASMLRGMYAFLIATGSRKQREFAARTPPPAGPQYPMGSPASAVTPPRPVLAHADLPAPPAQADPVIESHGDLAIQEVFAAARSAAATAKSLGLDARLEWIRRIKNHLVNNREELAREIAREAGKDNFEAMVQELLFVLAALEYDLRHARNALRTEKVHGPPFHFGKKSTIHYEPVGVVLVLAPYNYPLALGLLPALEAIMAGNAVILKPSERCPLAAIWAKLLHAAELPAGVLQVCHGDATMAVDLIHAGPNHIHLTGGSETGAKVAGLAAAKLIPVSAELGGKDVAVVFPDADIDRAIECLVWAFFVHHGQTCTAIKRLLVHESIYPTFLARFTARLADLSRPAGDTLTSGWTWDAPPFRAAQAGEWIAAARAAGARVVFPPHTEDSAILLAGPLAPVVVGNVTPRMTLWQQETWGPLLAAGSFADETEAISMANDCRFGLGASVWTKDMALGNRVAAALEVGCVSINNALATMTNPALPYGGSKASGWGRVRGKFGLRAFCNIKSVLTDHGSSMEPYWHPYTAAKTRLFSDLLGGAFSRGWAGKWSAFIAAGKLAGFMRRKR